MSFVHRIRHRLDRIDPRSALERWRRQRLRHCRRVRQRLPRHHLFLDYVLHLIAAATADPPPCEPLSDAERLARIERGMAPWQAKGSPNRDE